MTGGPSESVPGIEEPCPPWLQPSAIICSRFHILEPLGAGTVARAFLCLDALVEEKVVCKVAMRLVDTLVKEQYRSLRRLRSFSLPTPIGYFEHLQNDEFWPVLVVDHAEGAPMHEWARTASLRARVDAFGQLAAALAELEKAEISHGDLWGPNVIVSATGSVKLIDPDGDRFGRSRSGTSSMIQDVMGFLTMLEEFLPPPGDRAVAPLKARLREKKAPLAFAAIASELQALLRNPLPGELTDSLLSLAPAVAADQDGKTSLFRRIVERRHLEFQSLRQRVEVALGPLRCVPISEQQVVDVHQAEIKSVDAARGELWNRTLRMRSADGDELWVYFDAVGAFRKPWPDPQREGLLTVGGLNVQYDNQLVTWDALELWHLDAPTLMVQQGTRAVYFMPAHLDRMALILIGRTWPALKGPYHSGNQYPVAGMDLFKYRTLLERRRLPLDPKSWLRTIVRLILQSPLSRDLTSASPDGQFGSGLHTFFDTPPPARLALVQSVGERIIKTVGANFQSIYRIDVTKADQVNRSLEVVLEGRVGGQQDVLWTFELASPRILGEFRPQLTMSLVSPEDPPEKRKPARRTRATKKTTKAT